MRRVDSICFLVNSKRCNGRWKGVFDQVILLFSDQQLITGLAIMVAGYSEALNHDLSSYHWQIVVHLTWISSSVHLMTLSVLRNWLNENLILRNLRLFTMFGVLGLLAFAMSPTLNIHFLGISAIPVRCFWDDAEHSGSMNYDTIVSYIMLFTGYIWKVAQILDGRHNFLKKHILLRPITALEQAAKRYSTMMPEMLTKNWILLKLTIYCYVLLMATLDVVESFMTTLIFLCTIMIWGTAKIYLLRSATDFEVKEAESRFSFGQILPLFLLLQPLSAVVEHLAAKTSNGNNIVVY